METKNDWSKKSHDEVMDYFYNRLPKNERYSFLLERIQDTHLPDVDLVEMLEDTAEYTSQNIEYLSRFADTFFAKHPGKYALQYEFLEKNLIEHAFLNNDKNLLLKRIEVLSKYPVKGIDTVVMPTLFKLIFHGYYNEALAYSHAVWKPLSQSEKLFGYPEYPFVTCIYLSSLEKQFESLKNGDSSGWKSFLKEIKKLGFDNEPERINVIYENLIGELNHEKIVNELSKKTDSCFLSLNIQFLKYMKSEYGLPFMISDLFFNIILKKDLFGKVKHPGAFLYIEYHRLDNHITERYDNFLLSNQVEIFGKTWGLHYVYEFFKKENLIAEPYYTLMLENIALIKREFMAAGATDLWNHNFVNSWPASSASVFHLPENTFINLNRSDYDKAVREVYSLIPDLPGQHRAGKTIKDEILTTPIFSFEDELFNNGIEKPNVKNDTKAGRNDLCPCGSGKKFKNCCLNNLI